MKTLPTSQLIILAVMAVTVLAIICRIVYEKVRNSRNL